jgi:small subunit ribosomal protein S6
MAEQTIATRQYEGMFLIGPAATQENEGGIKLVRAVLERHNATPTVLKKWDERKLTYEVKRQKRGTFIITYFTALPSAIAGIERDVKLSEDILRVLVTEADHLTQAEMEAVEPQPIQPREERPSWDRPSFNDRPPRRDDRGGDRGGDRGPRREEASAGADAKD